MIVVKQLEYVLLIIKYRKLITTKLIIIATFDVLIAIWIRISTVIIIKHLRLT
jgi:hypothetical protein